MNYWTVISKLYPLTIFSVVPQSGCNSKEITISRIIHSTLVCIMFFTSMSALGSQLIAHKEVAEQELSVAQLRRIYSMRQTRWSDNTPITLFVLPSQHQVHKTFAQQTLKILPYKLERIWNKSTFSGLGVAPIVVNSPDEMLKAVASTPGALGYMQKNSRNEQVNVIEITK